MVDVPVPFGNRIEKRTEHADKNLSALRLEYRIVSMRAILVYTTAGFFMYDIVSSRLSFSSVALWSLARQAHLLATQNVGSVKRSLDASVKHKANSSVKLKRVDVEWFIGGNVVRWSQRSNGEGGNNSIGACPWDG